MTEMMGASAIRRMLVAAIGAAGSQKTLAKRHGMSTTYVSEVVRGTRDLGPAVLEALGLEQVVGYRRTSARLAVSGQHLK